MTRKILVSSLEVINLEKDRDTNNELTNPNMKYGISKLSKINFQEEISWKNKSHRVSIARALISQKSFPHGGYSKWKSVRKHEHKAALCAMILTYKHPFLVSEYFLKVAVNRIMQYLLKPSSIGDQLVYSHDKHVWIHTDAKRRNKIALMITEWRRFVHLRWWSIQNSVAITQHHCTLDLLCFRIWFILERNRCKTIRKCKKQWNLCHLQSKHFKDLVPL